VVQATNLLCLQAFYTGYGVKDRAPLFAKAIELKKWKLADEGIVVVARACWQDEAALISFPPLRKLSGVK